MADDARAGSWIPPKLERWRPGLELLHDGRGESALDSFLALHEQAPDDACGFYFPALLYSAFEVGPLDRGAREERGRTLVTGGIDAGEREVQARPEDLAARYCLGALYGLQARDRLTRSQHLRAAYDAKHARRIMLDVLAEAPSFQDCRFWTGSYDYFAAVLPAVIKFFRTLLFLPGGDREAGLQALEETARSGILEAFTSYAVLKEIYRGFEKDGERSRDLLERFHHSYPHSAEPALALARALADGDAGERHRSIQIYKSVRDRLGSGEIEGGARLEDRVHVGLGRAFLLDVNPRPGIPGLRRALERAGNARSAAAAAFVLVPVLNATGEHGEAARVAADLRRRYPEASWVRELEQLADLHDEESSRVASLLLPARRTARRGAAGAAELEYRLLLERLEDGGQVYYWMGETYFRTGRDAEAEEAFARVVELDEAFPRFAVPRAHLRLGNLRDLGGDRAAARKHYRLAARLGAEVPGLPEEARRWLAAPFTGADREAP